MTDERLAFVARQTAAMAKTELRVKRQLNGILASYHETGGLHRMRSVERLIVARAGPGWLDDDRAKDTAFGILRAATASAAEHGIPQPDAMAIATAINEYRPTPAFLALPDEERDRLWKEHFPRRYPEYFRAHDALMVVAQTPERVCLFRQKLQGMLLIGDPEMHYFADAEWEGRLKLFGPPDPEIMAAIRERR